MMDPIAQTIVHLSPRKLFCLKNLVLFLGSEGRYPSIKDLALRTGLTRLTVWLCLKALAEDGVLEKPSHKGKKTPYTLSPLGMELVRRLSTTAWAGEERVGMALSLLLGFGQGESHPH